jgi:hypothetical protein
MEHARIEHGKCGDGLGTNVLVSAFTLRSVIGRVDGRQAHLGIAGAQELDVVDRASSNLGCHLRVGELLRQKLRQPPAIGVKHTAGATGAYDKVARGCESSVAEQR